MSDAYLDNTLHILEEVKRRENFVQDELNRLGPTCAKRPFVLS